MAPASKKAKGKSKKDELLARLEEDEEIEEPSAFPDEDLDQFLNESDIDFSADEADIQGHIKSASLPEPTKEETETEAAEPVAEKKLSKKAEAKKRKRDEADAARAAAEPKMDDTPFNGK